MVWWFLFGCTTSLTSRPLPLSADVNLPPDDSGLVALTDTGAPDTQDTELGETETDTDPPTVDDALWGFIGSPCTADADCPYEGAVCLPEELGFPGGYCSAPCDGYCDDADGYPTTFCLDTAELSEAAVLGGGACLSRCDFAPYPAGGCRAEYGCAAGSRAFVDDSYTYVCKPHAASELGDCYLDLAARGVAFEPAIHTPEAPSDHPELSCEVEDALYLHSPVLGVELLYGSAVTDRQYAACNMAHALADTVQDVAADGVVDLYHYGTYHCRTISDSDTLSRHAYADAIDIAGFGFADGAVWTLYDDWEHDTTSFDSAAGEWLYTSAYDWYDAHIWTTILTPNYNVDHDDHFHVDLTPGSDFIGVSNGRYIGPAPYAD